MAQPKSPSFVFSYLPGNTTTAPATTMSSSESSQSQSSSSTTTSLLTSTSTLLKSIFQEPTRPLRTTETLRLESLQQIHANMEAHIATKRKAGMTVEEADLAGLRKVHMAVADFQREMGSKAKGS